MCLLTHLFGYFFRLREAVSWISKSQCNKTELTDHMLYICNSVDKSLGKGFKFIPSIRLKKSTTCHLANWVAVRKKKKNTPPADKTNPKRNQQQNLQLQLHSSVWRGSGVQEMGGKAQLQGLCFIFCSFLTKFLGFPSVSVVGIN